MKTYTTAEIEEREPNTELDGCYECRNDSFIEVRGEYECSVCGTKYGEKNR